MELSQILNSLGATGTEKTAEDVSVNTQTNTNTKLSEALNVALNEMGQEKTASATTPTEDLTKIASRLATAEQEALVKEAELYGAALCDGFMARMGQYDTTTATTKTASEGSFEKFASENPELVKQAAEVGYRETTYQLEKLAEDSYAEGYEKTAELIKTAAMQCAHRGEQDTYAVLSTLVG